MVGIVYPPMKSWNDSMSENELVSIFTTLNHRVALGGMSKQINAAIKKLRRVCDVSVKVRSLQGDSDLTASK